MSMSRIAGRVSRAVLNQCRHETNSRRSTFGFARSPNNSDLTRLNLGFNVLKLVEHEALKVSRGYLERVFFEKVVSGLVPLLHHSVLKPLGSQWLRFSSTASSDSNEKETTQTKNKQENKEENEAAPQNTETDETIESDSHPNNHASPSPKRKTGAKRTAFSDSDSDSDSDSELFDLSRDDLVKLVAEKENSLVSKQEEIDQMKDKVLRSFAEMENVKDRTRRESENSKKFAIQNFAKSLLDVADNLGRASSAAKESFSKLDISEDSAGAVKQLKTLLEGVEMTEKQLAEVFKKFGLEKYNPVDEEFDPNRHNAVFQVPDSSKPADHVAVVLKAGYILHDRVIRPAEVGVTVAANDEES